MRWTGSRSEPDLEFKFRASLGSDHCKKSKFEFEFNFKIDVEFKLVTCRALGSLYSSWLAIHQVERLDAKFERKQCNERNQPNICRTRSFDEPSWTRPSYLRVHLRHISTFYGRTWPTSCPRVCWRQSAGIWGSHRRRGKNTPGQWGLQSGGRWRSPWWTPSRGFCRESLHRLLAILYIEYPEDLWYY